MLFTLELDDSDVTRMRAFFEAHRRSPFVRNRIRKNTRREHPEITKGRFWHALVTSLLTTQQKSGPESVIARFIRVRPFPLSLRRCRSAPNVSRYARGVIRDFGGIRRGPTIGGQLEHNLAWLDDGGWKETIRPAIASLIRRHRRRDERNAAEAFMALKGLGPKQSRNCLQMLGLTRYETPLDSRVIKWLNETGFPFKLSSAQLSDANHYNFVMDCFQKVAAAAGIYPCVLDAAIFASYDTPWSDEQMVF